MSPKALTLVNAFLLSFSLSLALPLLPGGQSAEAQTVNNALPLSDLPRQLRESGRLIREYSKKHDHFPASTSEMDELLLDLYKNVSMTAPDSRVQVKSDGRYRNFYNFSMGVDPAFKSIPLVNGVPQINSLPNFPAGHIVIMTDGQDECVGWAAGEDGRPMMQNDSPVFFYETIATKEESSQSGSSSDSK